MSVKPSTIVWMVLWVVAAFGLYMVKYKVQSVRTEVASTQKQLREDKKNLHVLMAEWTYLNRPERLKELSAKYLNVAPATGKQMGDFAGLGESSHGLGQPASAPGNDNNEDGTFAAGKRMTLVSGVEHAR